MTNPSNPRRLPFCGNLSHAEIGTLFHQIYDNAHPDLTPYRVEQIHRNWIRIGKKAWAGRL